MGSEIRRAIRECDYFMPLISAATERRKEGYFRREWRLAAERTLDMADDVLLLLPVVLDETSEAGARVPDKFNTVQWLRVAGGRSKPALEVLIQRLLAGDHTASPRPPLVSRSPPPDRPRPAPPDTTRGPRPCRRFPHAPATGGFGARARFIAEILWWIVTAVWILVIRLPKWACVLLVLWFVASLLGTCTSRFPSRPPRGKPAATPPTVVSPPAGRTERTRSADVGIEPVVEALAHNPNLRQWTRGGEEFARRVGATVSTEKRSLLAPVTGLATDSAADLFVSAR